MVILPFRVDVKCLAPSTAYGTAVATDEPASPAKVRRLVKWYHLKSDHNKNEPNPTVLVTKPRVC